MKLFSTSKSQGFPGVLITGAIALVAIVYVFFVFLPAHRVIRQSQQELREMQQHIVQADGLLVTMQELQQNLAATQKLTKIWKQSAPTAGNLTPCFAKISEEAQLAKVRIVRLDPQPAKQRQTLQENAVALSLEGNLNGIFEFFRRLEELPQTTWLREVHFQRSAGTGETLRCDLTLTIFGDLADKSD